MARQHELYDEADQLKEQGKLEEAVGKLNEAVGIDVDFALGHSALAVILGKLGRHADAVRHAQRVCELEPNDSFSFTALSVICQRAGMIPEAEDAMARAHVVQQQRR